jgi:cytochrome P450
MASAVAPDQVPYLDILAPDFRPDAPEVIAAREANWYARTPLGIAVLRYEQVSELLSDRRFAHMLAEGLRALGVSSGPLYDWVTSSIINTEGADHSRLRRLVSKAFTPRAVAALRPRMREVATQLVDQFAAAGRCEFMSDFADLYSTRIICEMLAVPAEQQADFRRWADLLSLTFSPEVVQHRKQIEAALAELYQTVDVLVEYRRNQPGPDLLSALIAAEEAGDRLSARELQLMVSVLLFAGHDTTRTQLGGAMALFIDHPQQWRLLAERPELAEQATDEVLRVAPVTSLSGRTATQTLTFRGLEIPAGTTIFMVTYPANTDPTVFGTAAFDITARRPAPQLTFGGGIHYCLGAALAKAEIAEALPILARRMHDPELAEPVQWRPHSGPSGPRRLLVRFTPGDGPTA